MSSGNSSRRYHRGPKPARCPRAATNKKIVTSTTSNSTAASTVSFSTRSSSTEPTDITEPSPVSVRSTKSVGSAISLANSVYNVIAPDLDIRPGDTRTCFTLQDKGKLVVIKRVTGETVYMLRCVDGRRVFVEKALEGASLILTNQKGRVIKSLAGQY